jgi:hypothetical protein
LALEDGTDRLSPKSVNNYKHRLQKQIEEIIHIAAEALHLAFGYFFLGVTWRSNVNGS